MLVQEVKFTFKFRGFETKFKFLVRDTCEKTCDKNNLCKI